MQNGLQGRARLRIRKLFVTRVWIPIETRKVARTHFQSNPVPNLEQVRSRAHINIELIDFARGHQLRLRLRLPNAGTDDAVGKVSREAAFRDIDKLGSKISVRGGRRSVKRQLNWSRNLELLG